MRDLVATWRGEWPNTSMCPLVGYNKPSSSLTVVDLPEPFGPSRPKTSPRRTSKSTLSTARAFARPQKSLNTLVRPRTATTTSCECGVRSAECAVGSVTVMCYKKFNAAFRPVYAILLQVQTCPTFCLLCLSMRYKVIHRPLEIEFHLASKM